jgi:hypothetical protein
MTAGSRRKPKERNREKIGRVCCCGKYLGTEEVGEDGKQLFHEIIYTLFSIHLIVHYALI